MLQAWYCDIAGCLIPTWLPPAERLIVSVLAAAVGIPVAIARFKERQAKAQTAKPWWQDGR
jgi:hypothetical protein